MDSSSKPLFYKNLTWPWLIGTSLGVWFLFWHSPSYVLRSFKDPPFFLHLLGAYTIYVGCMINTLFTPSTTANFWPRMHNNVGQVAMIAGLISFVLGAFCAWSPTRGDRLPPRGFSIGITIGGSMQLLAQVLGYRAIQRYKVLKESLLLNTEETSQEYQELVIKRDACLKSHIYYMAGLFLCACGVPAMMRISNNEVTYILLGIAVLQIASVFMTRSFYAKILLEKF